MTMVLFGKQATYVYVHVSIWANFLRLFYRTATIVRTFILNVMLLAI